MPEITPYTDAYYSMTWEGPRGYPQDINSGRCYITGMLGMLRLHGEDDVLFADGTSGDGFSFRWCPTWGAPAFNGGTGPFHEIWEYTPRVLGFSGHWEEDPDGGWDEAWAKLRSLVERGLPVQVGTHYSVMLPEGAKTSPRLEFLSRVRPGPGFGHHIVIAGYDLDRQVVTVYEPNDVLPHARYECPINVFRRAWEESAQREGGHYSPWPNHRPWDGEWSLHDGYGPYQMMWVEPGRDPAWDIAVSIRSSFRRNLKILRGEYPKPYATFANQWQIPTIETGAPGMARCAEAIRAGRLKDIVGVGGKTIKLFVQGNIPNHGVLGRAGAAGYLRRVAAELTKRGLNGGLVAEAADRMQESSNLFRKLRYEETLMAAGDLLGRIADCELAALDLMERAWPEVPALR
ncbi:MAG: hypothetical protein HY728_10415 [Candidatus Rokubacteria bacterium]|nr:hypothetical protein [Candidatus Rokubacteria bacterium]